MRQQHSYALATLILAFDGFNPKSPADGINLDVLFQSEQQKKIIAKLLLSLPDFQEEKGFDFFYCDRNSKELAFMVAEELNLSQAGEAELAISNMAGKKLMYIVKEMGYWEEHRKQLEKFADAGLEVKMYILLDYEIDPRDSNYPIRAVLTLHEFLNDVGEFGFPKDGHTRSGIITAYTEKQNTHA